MTKSFDIARKMSKEPLAVTDLTATTATVTTVDSNFVKAAGHDHKDMILAGQYYRLQSNNGALEFYFYNGTTWVLRAKLAADGKFYAADVGIL